jgi:lysophospholipase L1-like esterase
MFSTKASAAAAALAVALGAGAASAAGQPVPAGSTYVALGSSYAAGPAVTEKAADSLGPCGQSRDNYARQLARLRGLTLIDRSCGGATTVDVLHGGQFGLPPQLDGLTPDARLVTVTIGGNDVRYMADLGVAACRHKAEETHAAPTRPCPPPAAGFDMEQAFTATAANLRAIAAEVRRRSPQARLVFVDYITVLPSAAPCAVVSLTGADAEGLRLRAERLARLTAEVAREAGADLIKASNLSRGHDACAAEPWVQGYALKANPADWGPVAFHPLLPAMTAIAAGLDRLLGG